MQKTGWGVVCVLAMMLGLGCVKSDSVSPAKTVNQPPAEDPFDPDRPPTAKTLYLMADMLSLQGKDTEAEQIYRRILTEYPDFPPAYNKLALLLMRQRRIQEAMQVLKTGLQRRPSDPVLLNNTGMCWLIRKQYPNALEYFTKAAAVVPENTRYRSNMATALALMGRWDEAKSLYEQIIPKEQAEHNIRILQKNIKLIE